MSWFHSHRWNYLGSERVYLRHVKQTYMVSIYKCPCGKTRSYAVDMAPYLALKEIVM